MDLKGDLISIRYLKYFLKLYSGALSGIVALRILGITYRYEVSGFQKGMLYGIWHGSMFPLIYLFRNKGINVIVNEGIDGDILAIVLKHYGFNPIRVSTPITHNEWNKINYFPDRENKMKNRKQVEGKYIGTEMNTSIFIKLVKPLHPNYVIKAF